MDPILTILARYAPPIEHLYHMSFSCYFNLEVSNKNNHLIKSASKDHEFSITWMPNDVDEVSYVQDIMNETIFIRIKGDERFVRRIRRQIDDCGWRKYMKDMEADGYISFDVNIDEMIIEPVVIATDPSPY